MTDPNLCQYRWTYGYDAHLCDLPAGHAGEHQCLVTSGGRCGATCERGTGKHAKREST